MGLEMTPPWRTAPAAARHHAALGEGDAAAGEAGEPAADLVGERLEGGLQRDLREAERERAQHVAKTLARERDVDEGGGERVAELAAEARGVASCCSSGGVSASITTVRVVGFVVHCGLVLI